MSSGTTSSSGDAALKRQPRARPRRSLPSDSLHIIPEVSEDEGSVSSCSSDRCPTSKHQRRRAQVTPADLTLVQTAVDSCVSSTMTTYNDILSIIVSPRPAPVPPSPTPSAHSGLSIWLDDMDFPLRFPRTPTHTPQNFPLNACSSPAPSLTDCSSPEGRSTGLPVTPNASDDETLANATVLPRRVTIKPLVIKKNQKSQPVCESDDDSELEDDSEWYARQLSQVVTLCSPVSTPVALPPARADSLTRRRSSKALPPLPRRSAELLGCHAPSARLDPTYHRRRSNRSTSRPPLPPFRPARPPPRVSIPADFDFDNELVQGVDNYLDVPMSATVHELDFDFKIQARDPVHLPLSLPTDPSDLSQEIASGLEALRKEEEHVLRSRWSSSTLSTLQEQDASVTSKLLQYFGGSSPKKGHKPRKSQSSTHFSPSSPDSHRNGKLKRRGAETSRHSPSNSVSSQESSTSSSSTGLRRKPIPLEFIKASMN